MDLENNDKNSKKIIIYKTRTYNSIYMCISNIYSTVR